MKIAQHLYILMLFYFISIGFSVHAQDLHYSQFFAAPLNINPALTGAFAGDIRVTGNFKNQWSSVPVDYNTFSLGVEKKLTKPLSIGAQINYDRAGDLNLSLASLGIAASYRIQLAKNHLVCPGLSVSINQRRIDFSNARTENQWSGYDFDSSIPAEFIPFNNNTFLDIGVGANYRYITSYRNYINAGVGVFHVNRPNQSLDNQGNTDGVYLARRISLYGNSSLELSDEFDLLLNVLFQNQSPYREFLLNAQGKLYLNDKKDLDLALLLGIGIRTSDSIYPMLGVHYQNILARLSYDINYTGFDYATSNNGGFELSVIYQLYKVLDAPFKPCPIY